MADTLDPANVRAIFKAYDVRGTVPDQIDEELARATGRAFVQVVGGPTIVVGHDMRPSSPGMAAAFAAGAQRGGRRRGDDRAGLDRPALLRLRTPRPPRRDVHREPQPGPVQRHQAVPGARPAGRAGDRPRRHPRPGLRPAARPSGPCRDDHRAATCSRRTPPTCSPWPRSPAAGSRSSPTPATGWPATPRPPSSAELGDQVELVPMYFELDGTFPHHEANPIDPANLVDLQARVARRGRRHRARLRRRRRPLLHRRRAGTARSRRRP